MSVPVFIERVVDAVSQTVAELSRNELVERISRSAIRLTISPPAAANRSLAAGFRLAADLAGRLYPRIALVGPADLTDDAAKLVSQINPQCDLEAGGSKDLPTLAFSTEAPGPSKVSVTAAGWNVYVDCAPAIPAEVAPPAGLAAGAIGMGELFRLVFDDLVPRPRRSPQPGNLNVITLGGETPLEVPLTVDLGSFHLAGAGAIGHAAALAIGELDARGAITVVDPETLDLSNVQRYVGTTPLAVGSPKTHLVAEILSPSSVRVEEVRSRWGADERSGSNAEVVLVGLDSDRDRIGVQAGLPRATYNAWTQPLDVGWSRHERFGDEACLSCLYWPNRPRPHRHELIAMALGIHPIRVLVHLATGLPVGSPLPPGFVLPPGLDPPPEKGLWSAKSVLDDVAFAAGIDRDRLRPWDQAHIDRLYREGICGGAILPSGTAGLEAFVPLAHQSALSGIMLVVQLVAARVPELAGARPAAVEGRLDVLSGLPQHFARPRLPSTGCICGDGDFVERWRERWGKRGSAH